MRQKIVFSIKFLHSYRNITHNLSRKELEKMRKDLINKLENLELFPRMYPVLLKDNNMRKIVLRKYIIVYLINNNGILIDNIIHQKSKYLNNQD